MRRYQPVTRPSLRAGNDPDAYVDVRNSFRVDWLKGKGALAGVAVGSVIALEALFAGPISGASMNPARSLAPAPFLLPAR